MEVWQRIRAGITAVMVVHRIVPYRDRSSVKIVPVRVEDVIHGESGPAVNPPGLPVIRNQRQPVRARINTLGNAQFRMAQFSLYVVQIAQGYAFRLFQETVPLLFPRFHQIHIGIISVDRPIEHHVPSRQQPVREHGVGSAGIAALVKRGIVALRAADCHIPVVETGGNHIGQVLNDVIRLLRGHILSHITG